MGADAGIDRALELELELGRGLGLGLVEGAAAGAGCREGVATSALVGTRAIGAVACTGAELVAAGPASAGRVVTDAAAPHDASHAGATCTDALVERSAARACSAGTGSWQP